MRRSWTIGQQIIIGSALPLLMLVCLGAFSYHTSQEQIETSRSVTHTHAVIEGIEDVLSSIKDAQTGQRGFVITGQEDFLEPYQAAIETITADLKELRKQTADNAQQQRRLDALEPLVRDKLAHLAETIALRRRDGFEAAGRLISSTKGKQLMDDIRRIAADMAAEERELLRQREVEATQASSRFTRVLAGGVGGTMLLVLLAAFVIVRGIHRQIGTTVQYMLSASAELQAAAAQQAKGAKGQVAASTEVATTMRELVTTSRQIAESAQRVMQIATDTAVATRTGDQMVHEAQRAIELVKHHVDRIVTHMLELGKRSQDIGGILDVINELSERTNILAINATIEAAGAGESGRRFSVVADEIRKLADRVAGSTKDIRMLIEEIRAASNTTVMATEDGAKAADGCLRQFAEMTSSLRRITESVSNTAQASREIELSTKQQTTAVEQVSAAIGDVAQTARETDASSGQTLETAAQLAGTAKGLAKLIRHEAPA
jgi:methyl-accepting chemotaxis protein